MCGNLEKGKNLHHLVRASSKDGSYVKAKTQYFYTFLSVFAIDTANGSGLAVLSFFLFKTLTFFLLCTERPSSLKHLESYGWDEGKKSARKWKVYTMFPMCIHKNGGTVHIFLFFLLFYINASCVEWWIFSKKCNLVFPLKFLHQCFQNDQLYYISLEEGESWKWSKYQ